MVSSAVTFTPLGRSFHFIVCLHGINLFLTLSGLLGEVVDIICSLVPGLVKIVASLAIDLVANLKVLECTQVLAKLHLS